MSALIIGHMRLLVIIGPSYILSNATHSVCMSVCPSICLSHVGLRLRN